MANIDKELNAWKTAAHGEDVRDAQIELSKKINTEVETAMKVVADYGKAETGRADAEKARVTAETKRQTDTTAAVTKTNKAATDAEEIYNKFKNIGVDDLMNEIGTKKEELFGVFTDRRAEAATGYWHKLFEMKVNTNQYTDINAIIAINDLYVLSSGIRASGIMGFCVRQGANGVLSLNQSAFMWLARMSAESSKKFALNVIAGASGNVVEFYVFNRGQNNGIKAEILSMSSGDSGQVLEFIGYKKWGTTETLTAIPAGGTVIECEEWAGLAQSGVDIISPTPNAHTVKRVTFKKPFINTPVVTLTVHSGVTGTIVKGIGVTAVNRSWFEMSILRENATDTPVFWQATEPTQ